MGYIHHNYSLFIQDILTLSNGSNLGNFYSLGCHSNAYEHDDCIGESYVLAQKGGGTTYIGNSHYGWYTPGSTNTLSCFYDQKFYESLCTHGIYHVGQTLADSKNRNSPKSDYEKFIWKELTLIGEPELPLWMRDPVKVEVDYPDTIQPGSQEFKIIVSKGSKPVQKALVCIRKPEDKIYAHGLTDSEGKKTFAISPSQGSMELTVTGRDILPHEGVVIVGIGTPLTITLDPDSRVITKPGVLGFTATIKNMSSKSCTCQFWSGLILWNGQSYSGNPLLGPKAITLAAGDSLVSHFEHPVTQAAPCTTYSYVADIGKFPNQVLDEASFDFKVR
jgi:hypothetical protein